MYIIYICMHVCMHACMHVSLIYLLMIFHGGYDAEHLMAPCHRNPRSTVDRSDPLRRPEGGGGMEGSGTLFYPQQFSRQRSDSCKKKKINET